MKRAFLDLVGLRLRSNEDCHFIGFGVSRHRLDAGDAAERVRDMPISEESILGAAVGMSRAGAEVFVDLMFEAFAYRTMDVLVNQMALSALLPAALRAPVTVRMICGPFAGAGPQHGSVGYALLARIPHLSVASPSLGADVALAYEAATRQQLPLVLLMNDGLHPEAAGSSRLISSRVRVLGGGARLGIVCWGLHVRMVTGAIQLIGAQSSTRVITPLFLSPLPVDLIVEQARAVDCLLIVDGPPPPAILGDLLALGIREQRVTTRTLHCSLWGQNVGAGFDEQLCIKSLSKVLAELL